MQQYALVALQKHSPSAGAIQPSVMEVRNQQLKTETEWTQGHTTTGAHFLKLR